MIHTHTHAHARTADSVRVMRGEGGGGVSGVQFDLEKLGQQREGAARRGVKTVALDGKQLRFTSAFGLFSPLEGAPTTATEPRVARVWGYNSVRCGFVVWHVVAPPLQSFQPALE